MCSAEHLILVNFLDAMLTFATAAAWQPQKVNWEIPASATEFLRPITVALTFAEAAVQRILNFRSQKSCCGRMAAVGISRLPYSGSRNMAGSCTF